MPDQTNYHYLEWNPARVARFWDFAAHWESWQEDYFSKQVGAGVVNCLRHLVLFDGRTLDYGCGPGYLVEHLLKAGIRCEAVDSSAESVRIVNRKFAGDSLWRGARVLESSVLPFADDSLDLILCVETVEHVLPAYLENLLGELRRILKPGNGRLFITTPNSENLMHNAVYCAECGSVFHRYQHISSFTSTNLTTLMQAHGFRTVVCNVTNFDDFQQHWRSNPLNWSVRHFGFLLLRALGRGLDLVRFPRAPIGGYEFRRLTGKGPHLFLLGGKD